MAWTDIRCRYCLVACIDYRIQPTLRRLLRWLGVRDDDYDHVAVARGAGHFERLLEHMDIAVRVHDVQSFLLTVHEDCRAGARRSDLLQAMKLARERHPDRQVRGFFVWLDGTWEEVGAGE